MKKESLNLIIISAMFAALTCIATMVIQIPSPMSGYVNLGDCVVLLGGFLLGPSYGAAAAGIGSMLADLLAGYPHYALGTLVIKALMAVIAALLFRLFARRSWSAALAGVAAEIWMVLGYFAYAALLLGNGLSAASSIPGNLMQGLFGVVVSTLLLMLFSRVPAVKKHFPWLK